MKLADHIKSKWHGLRSLLAFDNRVQLFVERTLFLRTKSVVHRIGGMEVLVDYGAGEQNGTRACLALLPYARFVEEMAFEAHPLRIIDLGANGGGFSLMLRRMGHDLKKVVAVELNPRTFGRLSFNLYRNLDCELELHCGAINDIDGELELFLGDGSISDSIYGTGTGGRSTKVRLISLARLIESGFGQDEVDICKMDVEGSEFAILGDDRCLAALQRVRCLILEVHDARRQEWVDERMGDAGFRMMDVVSRFESTVFGYSRNTWATERDLSSD